MISTGLAERVGISHAIRLCANGVGYRRGQTGGNSRVVGNPYLIALRQSYPLLVHLACAFTPS